MSFSEDVKKELSQMNNYVKKEELKAELYGYILTNNVSDENTNLKFTTKNEDNIYRYNKILNNLNIKYKTDIRGKMYITIITDVINLNIEKSKDINILGAIIRGCFMGGGSINNPDKENHLEILLKNENSINEISEILSIFNINIKLIIRNGKYAVYIKDGDMISKFLALIGAKKSVLDFEEIRVMKEMKNSVNRLVNCETANLNKVINVSVLQINDIKYIISKNKFNLLPKNLQEIALIRLKNEHSTLTEIGKMLENHIRKSSVNYKNKKISEFAEKLREEEEK